MHKNGHLAMHGKRRVLGVDDVADQDEYDEFDELPAKGSRTPQTEKVKSSENPSSFGVDIMIPVPPCTRELSCKASFYAHLAT